MNILVEQRRFVRWLPALMLLVALSWLGNAQAQTVVTAATGGGAISADSAVSGAWTTLSGPAVRETVNDAISTGTIVLTIPTGFVLNTANTVTATVTCTNRGPRDTVVSAPVLSGNTISINVTQASAGGRRCTITWANIQVRAAAGTPLATGNITRSGTATGIVAGANWGTLTEVAGAVARMHTVLPGQGFTSGTGVTGTANNQVVAVPFNITALVATDQFNNLVTSYSGSKTIQYAGPTSGCVNPPVYTTAVSFTNGQSTTTLTTTLFRAETTSITAREGALTGIPSSLTVGEGAISRLVVTLPGETFTPCAGNSGTVANQTVGIPFTITRITATDIYFNPITSYAGTKTLIYSGPSGTPSYTTSVDFSAGQSVTALTTTLSVVETTNITAREGPAPGLYGWASSALTVVTNVSSFDVVEAGAARATPIRTKVAGTTFSLDVLALQADNTISTGFVGEVTLTLVDSSTGTCSSMTSLQNFGTVTFVASNNGRLPVNLTYAEAAPNVRIRVHYAATGVTACSFDNFAIRPANLALVNASDANWETAGAARTLANNNESGGNVHKAGRPFTLRATAQNAANVTTSGYNGGPTVKTIACTLPTPTCVNGTLVPGAWAASGGVVTSSTVTYSEAGSFNLTLEDRTFANVDAADSSLAERTIPQAAAVTVGRFVPDHFVATATNIPMFKTFNTDDASCVAAAAAPKRSFTYIGQRFGYVAHPQATFEARNFSGAATLNYSAGLWKVAAANVSQTYTTAEARSADVINAPAVAATAGNSGTGTVTVHADDALAFARNESTTVAPLAPQATFSANISLAISVTDTTENAVSGNGIIGTTTAANFSNMAFDAGKQFRYGRLKLSNAHGSELLKLPVPSEVQYWNGSMFVTNTADHCTVIPSANITLAPTTCSAVIASNSFLSGRDNLKLNASNAKCSALLTINLGAANKTYLQGRWTGTNYNQNPGSKVTFGLYKGTQLIYVREMY